MKKTLLIISTILCTTNVSALTLNEALEAGYKNNEELKIIRNDFLNEIEKFPRALADFMPRISATGSTSNIKNKNRSKLPRVTNGPSTELDSFNKSVTLDQPIFNGWSSVSALRSAQASFRASRSDYYAKEQENFIKEISVYLECVAAREKYNISKISVKSNITQLEAMEEKLKLGESTETEVASAREGLATAEANQALAEAEFEASKANFYKTFGVEPTEIEMAEVPLDLPKSYEEFLKTSLANNPSVDGARHRISSSKADENAAKGDLLPKVSVRIQGGTTEYKPEQLGSYQNNRSVSTTLSVNVPILNRGGAEYSDIRRAKYQTKRTAIGLDNVIKQIEASTRASWSEFEASKFRVLATNQAVRAAEIAYDGMTQEEILGSKTIIDVLRAEERLNKAREVNVEARKAVVLSAYKIKSLMGTVTAKSLKLRVKYFEPEAEFKKAKLKIVGF